MKNTIKWFGVIALVSIIGFSMAGCGDDDESNGAGDDGSIPNEWRVTYSGSPGTITIGANSLSFVDMYWPGEILNGNGTLTDMTIEQGGTITEGPGGPVGGKYVYLLRNGQRFGILVHIEVMGRFIGIGSMIDDGADELIDIVEVLGGVFNPSATVSGMPTDFAWGGNNL